MLATCHMPVVHSSPTLNVSSDSYKLAGPLTQSKLVQVSLQHTPSHDTNTHHRTWSNALGLHSHSAANVSCSTLSHVTQTPTISHAGMPWNCIAIQQPVIRGQPAGCHQHCSRLCSTCSAHLPDITAVTAADQRISGTRRQSGSACEQPCLSASTCMSCPAISAAATEPHPGHDNIITAAGSRLMHPSDNCAGHVPQDQSPHAQDGSPHCLVTQPPSLLQ